MLPNLFRKYVVGSKLGYALYIAVAYFVFMTFLYGLHPYAIAINAVLGLALGMVTANRFHKDNKYIVQKINNNEFALTKKYKTMLRQNAIPKSKKERAGYLEYLNNAEATKVRLTGRPQLGLFVFLLLIFILSMATYHLFNIITILLGLLLINAWYLYLTSKRDLKKIEALKAKL